jgi:hypothetical protein
MNLPATRDLAVDLVANEILSDRNIDCKEARPTAWTMPTQTLVGRFERTTLFDRFASSAPFFLASMRANRYLKTRTFESIIRSVVRRREADAYSQSQIDLHEVKRLTKVFNFLRPFFPRNYLCLFDSLALIEFLAYYHLFPTWVFGVRPEPFEAHCWVQTNDLVLNDTVEHLSVFIPIMTV